MEELFNDNKDMLRQMIQNGGLMEYRFIILLIVILFSISIFTRNIYLETADGDIVVLHEDYTWEYQEEYLHNFDFSIIQDDSILYFLKQGIYAPRQQSFKLQRYTMPCPKNP